MSHDIYSLMAGQYLNPYPKDPVMQETELRKWCLEKAISISPHFADTDVILRNSEAFLNFVRNPDDSKLLAAAREFAGKVSS